ncbi:hypothetical protein MHK_000052 [Candidatus Magnetomorum sp. HK-1]|nr:hypothetical protein MHK_000052 [Candidatus Magnetomorum sp. HK-1]
MYQLIYSIVITLLVAGCAVQHETISLPEKSKPVVLDNKESDRKESKEDISGETLNAASLKQKVLAYIHQEIKDPEKVKQIETMINAMSEKEVIEWLTQKDSEKNIPPERQQWKEIMQQVVKAYQSGHYSQGIEFAKKAYQYALKNFGETDPDTLTSINNLAELYRSQGRYGEAEPLYKRCLQLKEEVLGPKHPSTLTSINNLAGLYRSQGRYGEAEPLYKRCLQLKEEVLGPKHPSTLTSINNLAGLYRSQGRYGEAEPLYKRCLQLSEEVLGPKHPDTLTISLNYCACLVMLKQDNQALLHLKKLELSLRHYTGDMLKSTQQLRVRRKFMMSKSTFQDVLFTLAFQSKNFIHPGICRGRDTSMEMRTGRS